MGQIRVIGHRGCGMGRLENTLRSIKEALELGADGVEIDVHASLDGEIVVIHDPDLERTTNGSGFVNQKTLKQLKKLDAGEGELIPTLQEVIEEIIEHPHSLLNIEIKPPDIEQQVLNIINEYDIMDRVIISSFLHSPLSVFRKLNGEIITGLLYSYSLDNPVKLAQELDVNALHPLFPLVTTELVEQCRKAKLLINPWTVDDESEMKRLIDLGVDNIITDFPNLLLKLLR
ncbi:MAG: glycerophosphodiester phosphodiesterase [Promethearchaeota archaeon]